MEEIVTLLNDTARRDKDNLIPIDGATGSGKSTLGLKMCLAGCPWFDMEKDILYSRDELVEWVTTAKPGSWALADEAVNMLFKRDFATKAQKFLLRILDMCRDRNLTILMCIPNFWALDAHVRQGRVRLRIYVAMTGRAFMWKPDTNPFADDRWWKKYNEKVCWNWADHYNARKTKGFIGFIEFGDLAEKYKEPYLRIKKQKKEMIKKLEDKEEQDRARKNKQSVEIGKMMLLEELQETGFVSRGWEKALAARMGITAEALRMRIKRWKDSQQVVVDGEEPEPNLSNMPIEYNNSNKELNFEESP
jgi:hypothetical protein